jgi:hypothetical protein
LNHVGCLRVGSVSSDPDGDGVFENILGIKITAKEKVRLMHEARAQFRTAQRENERLLDREIPIVWHLLESEADRVGASWPRTLTD